MIILQCYDMQIIINKKSYYSIPIGDAYDDHLTSTRRNLRIYYVKLLATVAVGINAIATVAVTTVTRQQD